MSFADSKSSIVRTPHFGWTDGGYIDKLYK
jgi:hypothetical protein